MTASGDIFFWHGFYLFSSKAAMLMTVGPGEWNPEIPLGASSGNRSKGTSHHHSKLQLLQKLLFSFDF